MLFYDGLFVVFLAAVLLLLVLFRGPRIRTWLLLVGSYLFYAAWDWRFLALIAASTAVDFMIGRELAKFSRPAVRRALLSVSVSVNLAVLAVFKYLDFFIDSLNAVLGTHWALLGLTLPVGISFFTFQSMSYTIDVYRRETEPCSDPVRFALYVSFFPQLVAGPIIRARDFLAQVPVALVSMPHRVLDAAPLFCLGLFKKVVIADNLAHVVNPVFADPSRFGGGDLLLGALAFTMQIYADFSGYTDMALALCTLLGFSFPLNFRSPYLSLGPQEFWRRWHISLSSWLRDYLYISLGGNRHGPLRMYVALVVTMLLGGVWHGAAWTFVLWGVFHGIVLVLGRLLSIRIPGLDTALGRSARWLTFFALTVFGWILFRAESVGSLATIVAGLTNFGAPVTVGWRLVAMACAFVAMEHLASEHDRRNRRCLSGNRPLAFMVSGILLLGAAMLRAPTDTPFIYFQF